MNKKRIVMFLGLFLIMSLFLIGLVSAQSSNNIVRGIQNLVTQGYNLIKPLIEALLGSTSTSELFLAKFILAVILFAFVWTVLDKVDFFSSNTWVLVIISIAVPVLGIRFLSEEWVQTILLPYSTIGVVMTALVPLIIYFIFVEQAISSRTLRKIAWIFAAVVFIGLYFTRLDELKDIVWVYPVVAIVCIFFLFFDKTIQRAYNKVKSENMHSLHQSRLKTQLIKEDQQLDEDFYSGKYAGREADYKRLKKDLKNRADPLGIHIDIP